MRRATEEQSKFSHISKREVKAMRTTARPLGAPSGDTIYTSPWISLTGLRSAGQSLLLCRGPPERLLKRYRGLAIKYTYSYEEITVMEEEREK